jgi:hypothetical protein
MLEMVAWVAVRADKEDALRVLALEETDGDTGGALSGVTLRVQGAQADDGWYVVHVNQPDHWLGTSSIALALSRLGPCVVCTTWRSRALASFHQAGSSAWGVLVENDKVSASGSLPPAFAAIEAAARSRIRPPASNRAEALARLVPLRPGEPRPIQEPLVQVPVLLAAEACGYDGRPLPFTTLRESRDARRSLGESWVRAGARLGVEVTAPFLLPLRDGPQIEAPAMVHRFGTADGFLVVLDGHVLQSVMHRMGRAGYGLWTTDARDTCASWDLDRFRRVLRDMGWRGPAAQAPAWLQEP